MAPARVSPARSAAYEVLLRVETRDSYVAELLHSNLLEPLSAADRGLATEIVMGALRWQRRIDQALESAAGKSIAKFDPEVKIALRIGAYQLLYLDRIPARAAVNESVEVVKLHGKRSAAPLVNAVLRKLSTRSDDQRKSAEPGLTLADAYSHPAWLVERWAKTYGTETTRAICDYDQQRPRATIRLSATTPQNAVAQPPSAASDTDSTGESACATSSDADYIREELERENLRLEPARLVSDAWHVVTGDITATRAYRERRLAVQDEASQLVALLAQGKRVLDCCAAPGGKSAVFREHNPNSNVISMDLHLHRVRLMRDLIRSHAVLAADARQLPFAHLFDCVIADLPCTGTGTLARNPEIKWRLTPDDLPRLVKLQTEILESVAVQAKRLVYSTCSLEPEEGEEIVRRFLSSHPEFRLAPVRKRLQELAQEGAVRIEAVEGLIRGDFLRTIPGIHLCDGFFAAVLERSL